MRIARLKPLPHKAKLILKGSKFSVQLIPNGVTKVSQQLPVGHKDTVTIEAIDANGNVIAFTPDAPPVWSDSAPSEVAEAISTDGLSNVLTAVGPAGQSSTIGVSLKVGGVSYTASDVVTVVAGAIAGIRLVHTLS